LSESENTGNQEVYFEKYIIGAKENLRRQFFYLQKIRKPTSVGINQF